MQQKRRENLFVYGTLLSTLNHPMHNIIKENCRFISAGNIQGKLYNIDWYPGLVLSNNEHDIAHGEIYKIINKEDLFAALDDYEGCSDHFPTPHAFQKKLCSITSNNDQTIQAWVYLYQLTTNQLKLIESGDFSHYSTE